MTDNGAHPMTATPEWHPIETAPPDRDVLVYNAVTGAYRSRRNETGLWPLRYWGGDYGEWFPEPTLWTELPRPTP